MPRPHRDTLLVDTKRRVLRSFTGHSLGCLAALLVGCAPPECTLEDAWYDGIGLPDGPVSPDNLLDLAADVRARGGLVVIGAVGRPVECEPRVLASTCMDGVCAAEARLCSVVIVSDTLNAPGLEEYDEVPIDAPARSSPTFVSDPEGRPVCGRSVEAAVEFPTISYNLRGFLLPRAGDTFTFFLGPPDEGGVRDYEWGAQTVGVSVSGENTQSRQDVGTYELVLP